MMEEILVPALSDWWDKVTEVVEGHLTYLLLLTKYLLLLTIYLILLTTYLLFVRS